PDGAIDKLVRSIKEYGWTNPVLVSADGYVLAGHARLKAAEKAGIEEVPVIYLPLEGAKADAYLIADNRLQDETDWDYEKLEDLLQELDAGEFDLELTGFDMEEIEDLMTQLHMPEEIVEDEVPEPPEEPITKLGDLWLLGRHRLLCGDSTDQTVVAKLMENQLADMIFTDPPYNVDYTGKTKDALTIKNDAMEDKNFRNFLVAAFKNMVDASKAGAPIYVCHADSEGLNFRSAFREAGWDLKQCIIWVKQHFVMGRQDYHWQHEPILYGWKPGAAHKFYGGRNQSTIWQIDRPMASREHPTMKPVSLCAKAIENSSKAGDIVLDLFGGSGSTLIACEQLNRTCYMTEIDPVYCDVIVQRYINLKGHDGDVYILPISPGLDGYAGVVM
ncbi:MAG TPA: site-specific DNA-methyltransferase, partial [Firmicutes bacterium]|nr:site-specific DNA-methyltransferase [Bacillota bacterium]